jgi:long-chain acyl-CoA synthetase
VRDAAAYDLSSLRLALDAAEPVRANTIEAFERAFGLRHVVVAGYGLAEATVGVSTWPAGEPPLVDARGVVSVGRPFRDIDIRILLDDRAVEPGRIGEIAVRSPANTPGYFGDEVETRRLAWGEGYIRTGDLGYLDDAGRLFVTGRQKNSIKHGGETIFPQEAEEAADRLPFARRSAAVGIDAGGPQGEQLVLFVELRKSGGHGEASLYDAAIAVVQAIHARLGFRPGRVYLLQPHAIPLTHNGKIRHAALRELYVTGELRTRGAILFPPY